MAASQSGTFSLQELSDIGAPLVGGRLYTYAYGTTTHKTAYTDKAGTIPHTYTSDGIGGQYIALNARGELPAPLYLAAGSYDIALKDSTGATIWTRRADPVDDTASAYDAAIRSDLASTADASKGASLIGWIRAVAGFVGRFISARLSETVHVTDFMTLAQIADAQSATPVLDCYSAVTAAIAAVSTSGGSVYIPYGIWARVNSTVLVPANVELVGAGSHSCGLVVGADVTAVRLTGNFAKAKSFGIKKASGFTHTKTGLDVGDASNDAGRSIVDDVYVTGMGSDGIQVRNGNLGTLRDITSIINGRDGINFTTETPDNNAWKLEGFLDLRGNVRDGLNFAQGSSASDPYAPKSNQGGLIVAQSNGRYGLYCGTRSNEFTVYAESNGTDIYIDTYAYGNEITVVQALAITDNGTGNIITTHSMNADYVRGFINQVIFSGKASKGLKISNDDGTTGTVSLQKTGANAYKLATNSSGGTHVFSFKNDDGLTYWRFYGPQLIDTAPAVASNAPTLASAGTIAPTTPIAFVSGTTTINTITAPTPFANGGGQITLIPTGLWATSNAGNIAIASTAVVSKALILTYDVTTGKWYPSY